LKWTKWYWNRFFSKYFGSPLSLSFHPSSTLIFFYMLLSPEGETAKPGNLPKAMLFWNWVGIG
jgi:hypothetical protein